MLYDTVQSDKSLRIDGTVTRFDSLDIRIYSDLIRQDTLNKSDWALACSKFSKIMIFILKIFPGLCIYAKSHKKKSGF